MNIITTIQEAYAAVNAAPWDELGDDIALSGAQIWGMQGTFAAPRAASFFTYDSAVAEVKRFDWSDGE